jgi:Zn-dependent protease with chaperone function
MTLTPFPGRYFDGKTALQHVVTAQVSHHAVRVLDAAGNSVAVWPLEELRLVERFYPGRPVRLTSEAAPACRLTVDDDGIYEALRAHGRLRRRASTGVGHGQRKLLAIAVVALLFIGGAVAGLPLASGPLAALVPLEWEEAMGERIVDGMAGSYGVCDEPAGLAALHRLGDRLAANIDTPYSFKIRVIDVGMVNAFAAPGGQVALLRGLIEKAESPDEVAGVLAHEMGHVVHRHPMRGLIRRLGLTVLISGLIGGDVAGEAGALLVELSYSREDEAAADEAAVDILADAGLRADGLVAFFDRLGGEAEEDQSSESFLTFFSTHPASETRRDAVARRGGEGGGPALSDLEWQALREICPD